ncbi:hypothetical protein F4780DRAFT_775711 [Xylariomycetidae sp. FL0641]|nr:hypothetical protein F4780DRAFT_775711 [Xylariomycetidae sp. FL0641]
MSSKRKFSDFNAKSSADGETRERQPDYRPFKKNKSKAGGKAQKKTKPNSTNWIKKRIRNIERSFKKGDSLPANTRNDLERELAHHQAKLDELADAKKRRKMIQKYHMVRFHERKKADRLAKQIRTQLETTTDPEESEKLKAQLHIAEIDGLYARYFPHRERYVSMYSAAATDGPESERTDEAQKANASTAARALQAERPPLWKFIEEAASQGTRALCQIQERRVIKALRPENANELSAQHTAGADQAKAKDAQKGKGKGKGKRQEVVEPTDADSDSDGGFFE